MRPKVSIVVPTYNERRNITKTLARIRRSLAKMPNYEVIVVDDSSPDSTWKAVERAQARDPRITLIKRGAKLGLSSAAMLGFRAARGKFIGLMDADLSHDPDVLPKLLAALERGNELAVGSRYADGGKIEGRQAYRNAISAVANRLARLAAGTTVSDPMSGFFFMRRELFERAAPLIKGRGFKILLEIIAMAHPKKIAEVGFVFKERALGNSKASIGTGLDLGLAAALILVRRAARTIKI